MDFERFLVVKIGSMALIDAQNNDIDYNKFARLGRELRPGMVLVSSGATEIGRLDHIKRTGAEIGGNPDDAKTDYAAQGQAILMQTYRGFIGDAYGIRQVLVEHQHFNDKAKREHIKSLLTRAAAQNAIPIVNYNDAVSFEELRKLEIQDLKRVGIKPVELVDNDETAAQIACLLAAKTLLILTSVDGIYTDPKKPSTLIRTITGGTPAEVAAAISEAQTHCSGASRTGAGGAGAKLEYAKEPVLSGARVIIANAKYSIEDILSGGAPRTEIGIGIK